ncbi:hypothetical protein KR093_010490 [Drosophila rubida]|uniref:Uncharacterized protein n=1 Tax=Drosophila rubida TaxID=30044 RepID=A0AAD4KCR8_9MUSC|nr:hypothetical protein KR093_010490 [Drosophila rubida]
MSSRKHRVEQQTVSSPHRARSQSQSQSKAKIVSRFKSHHTAAASANANANANARLRGIEDLAQFDNEGMPFILVDGMCTRNRQQLHLALSKCEKRRMKWIQRQCCVLPLLKYMKPASRAEPVTAAEKDAKAELDFKEDLKQLCISELTAGESFCRDGSLTPIAHSPSSENVHSTPRMQEIRSKLEELRHQQSESPPLTSSELGSPTRLCDRPKFMRQGTFDVHRDDRPTRIPFSNSKRRESPVRPSMENAIGDKSSTLQRQLVRSATMNQPRASNARAKLTKMNSSHCLFKDRLSNVQAEAKKSARERPFFTHKMGIVQPEKAQGVTIINSLESLPNYASIRATMSQMNNSDGDSTAQLEADRSQIETPAVQSKASSFLKISSRIFKKLKN